MKTCQCSFRNQGRLGLFKGACGLSESAGGYARVELSGGKGRVGVTESKGKAELGHSVRPGDLRSRPILMDVA